MNQSDEQHRIAIHQSLVRPALIAGVERELAVVITVLAFAVGVTGKDVLSIALAAGFWVMAMAFGRRLASRDQQLLKIFIRHLRYRDFYPAGEKIENP